MFIKKLTVALLGLALTSVVAGANATVLYSEDFSGPVATGPQAPGVWYQSSFNYAPEVFATSGGRLIETISSADSQANRPITYGGESYNFQGRMYDLPTGVIQITADIYIPSDWVTTEQRMGGMGIYAFDDRSRFVNSPTIFFTSNPAGGYFEGWGGGSWYNLGLPVSFVFDVTHQIGIRLTPDEWVYSLDGVDIGAFEGLGSTQIGNVMLMGYNSYARGETGTYDICWDNLVASNTVISGSGVRSSVGCVANGGGDTGGGGGGGGNGGVADVPEPGAMTLLGAGIVCLGLMRRSRKAVRLS